MSRYGAESAATKATSVNVDREFYHFVCWNAFVLILRVGETRIRKIKRAVNLFRRHGRVGRIDYDILVA